MNDLGHYPLAQSILEMLGRVYRRNQAKACSEYLDDLCCACRRQLPPHESGLRVACSCLLLALLVVVRAAGRNRKLGGESPEKLAALAKGETCRLAFLQEAARLQSSTDVQLAQDPALATEALNEVLGFECAIRPRRLTAAHVGAVPWRERLGAFHDHSSEPVDKLHRDAYSAFVQSSLTPTEAGRLLDKLPPAWLCTYSREHLGILAASFRKWDPLVRYIAGDDGVRSDLAIERRYNALLEKTRKCLCRVLPVDDVDDCYQDALLTACEMVDEPGRGYCYEGSLPSWLVGTANAKSRSHYVRVRQKEIQFPEIDVTVPISTEPVAEQLPVGGQGRQTTSCADWYPLVETYFRKERRAQVKEIWQRLSLLDKGTDSDTHQDDSMLADELSRSGPKLTRSTVAGYRRRLRLRLAPVHYVLMIEPLLIESTTGDAAMLSYIGRHIRHFREDIPTLRSIAAYARAGQAVARLGLILFTRQYIDCAAPYPHDSKSSDAPDQPAGEQRSRAQSWMSHLHNRRLLQRLRGQATRAGIRFMLGPCWYLAAACGQDVESVVGILRPGEEKRPETRRTEREELESLVFALKGGRP